LATFGPFDKILITAAAPDLHTNLISQLKTGGIIVVPLGSGEVQTMMRYTKLPDGRLEAESFGAFRFVPLLGEKAND
ncbi:MAG: protein-L-isoaspartate O-methyltransferase, partial [Bacteroidales bacterium]|nr:protein-L-isoaspartate O-methyltransferase [Bacteroidales bacterium]